MTKLYISWEKFHNDVKRLALKIQETGDFNKIIAISRGGLIPAGILAYELDIRQSDVINMSSYDNQSRRSDKDVEIVSNITKVDEKTLVIDDLADSGRTFKLLRHRLPEACYVTVYAKSEGSVEADIFGELVPNQWIVFPWDVE